MSNYKTRYEERRAAGLCGRCGKAAPVDGETACAACKEYAARHRSNLTDEQRQKRTQTNREWQKRNADKLAKRDKRYRDKLKQDILDHYGVVCACCGESNPLFLTLDHINGGGNKHRLTLFGRPQAGNAFYRKIRGMGYPDGFQTLCWNCNMAKAHYGYCPHQRTK